ncbi:MAG TPA: Eco57I restriction-modification methylase domain-containing protein [Acidobacteriota bacterium]|nr:Eco57I restriction-modification methylase domain-containing protein [Acidobacteriota bacterium]HQQ46975.1 Eco57I restriction-modification methylase domain-containing protein [Acidobacteriota bacterium]
MNHDQAKSLIKETFENPFDKNRFTYFGKNLLNKIEESPFTYPTQYIKESFKPYINSMERIGKYSDGSADIDILIVKLQKETTLERARTAQRNYIASYLNGSRGGQLKDAALVAYVSPEEEDWRFSLVKMDYRFEQTPSGKMKVKEEFTPARRWSFLVGANEKSHTAQSRFIPFLTEDSKKPQLDELAGAFNIETVTKEFFEKYRNLFVTIKLCLDAIISKDPGVKADFKAKGIDTVNFSKKLMGQIVFLYFLQKKGWFGVGKDKAWGTGSRNFLRDLLDKKHGNYRNFFNDMLEPLFYEALRTDRSDDKGYYRKFDCKIPFLNGGLFDPIGNYDWKKTEVILPNELFSNDNRTKEGDTGDGIFDIFDRFNFTVREDEPLDKEVAIDPELLGKAYEKFNAIRPDNFGEYMKVLGTGQENKFNKEFGVYYTPREIVHYMCQKSLEYYLKEEFREKVQESDMEDFVTKAEIVLENELVYQKKLKQIEAGEIKRTDYAPELPASILTNLELIDKKLEEIKICDPAVGSGAFPVGLMNEIVRLRSAIHILSTGTIPPLYDIKRNCIERSIYGVDIDEGAIEIARLRLWLSLVVDEDDIRNIKPLPNLDYKLVRGNSLLGVEKNIHTKPMLDELEEIKARHFNETDPEKKKKEAAKITELISEITDGHKEFDFEIYFSEVFKEKGGFDVVIGNPPYVGEKGNKEMFRMISSSPWGTRYYKRKMDLFYFFFHLALDLLKNQGSAIFITTSYWITADGAIQLRTDLRKRATLLQLLNFGELKLFENAQGQHNMITHLAKSCSKIKAQTMVTIRDKESSPEVLRSILTGIDPETTYHTLEQQHLYKGEECHIRLAPTSLELGLTSTVSFDFEKMDAASNQLAFYAQSVFRGVETGCDIVRRDLVDTAIEKNLITPAQSRNFILGTGIYVLSEKEYGELNLTAIEKKDCVKPFYKNSEIMRYYTPQSNRRFLLYVDSRIDINHYPNIKRHLERFRPLLAAREQAVTESHNWFWIRGSKRESYFYRKDTIVVPYRAESSRFSACNQDIFGAGDVYYITLKKQYSNLALLGYLNSSLVFYHLLNRGKRKGRIIEYYKNPLEKIPIHKGLLDDEMQTGNMTQVVNKILLAKHSNPEEDTSDLESQIDQMVYKLYGLTDEEIEIVEKETKGKKT